MKVKDQVVSLELSKKLKENGYPQEGIFWWVEGGQPYGDGYGNTARDLTKEMLVCVAEPQGFLGKGERSSNGGKDYRGDIKFDAVLVGEYGDDNYFHYPVSCVAPTVAELGEKLPHEFSFVSDPISKSIRITKARFSVYKTCEGIGFTGSTEAEARAKMWLFLKEKNLLKAEEKNAEK